MLAVARSISEGDRGVLICGSGVGASIAANEVPGIRAVLCHDTYSAPQGVEHAEFSGEERHVRRLAKIHATEEGHVD